MSEQFIDLELVRQVNRGDNEAFDILVLKYQDRVASLVSRFVDDQHSVNDVVQESFINAYRALDKFEGRSSFYTWLYRIAINTAKNHLKKKDRRPPDVDIDIHEAEMLLEKLKQGNTDTPERLLHCDEVRDAVMEIVNTLPSDLRIPIVLREMGGLSYEEIAIVMQCPVGTVRSRIARARATVDEVLGPLIGD